ncbi:MAG: dual specificity protein phosphatase family protein [Desulfacinum sp.]|nr:dual specificity protein phosphatase family protein [Desulfacinum sp.]
MSRYPLTWITEQLAAGHAPMSHTDLESLRRQGVDAILNLCAEFCDLHEIEEKAGFEIHYLPTDDEGIPEPAALERALDWLDACLFTGKKVLVHCRFGIGRTGTVLTAFLLRRGYALKEARKILEGSRARPESYVQWKMLRRYCRGEDPSDVCRFDRGEKSLVDLSPYFSQYEEILREADEVFHRHAPDLPRCGAETDACCRRLLYLQLVEAVHLNHRLGREIPWEERRRAVERAAAFRKRPAVPPRERTGIFAALFGRYTENPPDKDGPRREQILTRCPLSLDGRCLAFPFRPLLCRIHGLCVRYDGRVFCWGPEKAPGDSPSGTPFDLDDARRRLDRLSRRLLRDLTGREPPPTAGLVFPLPDVVSGAFVRDCFHALEGRWDVFSR